MNIITGTGRSGTSLMAKILIDSNYNLGNDLRFYKSFNAGYENGRVVELNNRIYSKFGKNVLSNAWLTEEEINTAVKLFGKEIYNISRNIEWVKDMRFSKTLEIWIKSGAKINKVIICKRRFGDAVESALRTGAAISDKTQGIVKTIEEFMKRYENLVKIIYKYDIPHIYVEYPDDYKTGCNQVAEFLNNKDIIKNCRRLFKE